MEENAYETQLFDYAINKLGWKLDPMYKKEEYRNAIQFDMLNNGDWIPESKELRADQREADWYRENQVSFEIWRACLREGWRHPDLSRIVAPDREYYQWEPREGQLLLPPLREVMQIWLSVVGKYVPEDWELYEWALGHGWTILGTSEGYEITKGEERLSYKDSIFDAAARERLLAECQYFQGDKVLIDTLTTECPTAWHVSEDRKQVSHKKLPGLGIKSGQVYELRYPNILNEELRILMEKAVAHLEKVVREVEQHNKNNKKIDKKSKMKKRWAGIELVAFYYGLPKMKAQAQYDLLVLQGKLEEVLAKAKDGETDPNVQFCPLCQSPMTLREGKFGQFFGCTKWPDCSGKRQSKEVKLSADSGIKSQEKMQLTMKFVEAIGGFDAARNWIAAAEKVASLL